MSKAYHYPPEVLERIQISLEEITPEIAKEWLDRYNTANYRSFKPRQIARYTRDMLSGNWRLTTDSIKFDWNGKLADGQNRLQSIIDANVTITMVVARGVDPIAADNMDTGAGRTAADMLKHHGGSDTRAVAAAVRIALWADAGGRRNWRDVPTHSEINTWVENHSDIYDSFKVLGPEGKKAKLRPSVRIFLAWRFAQEDTFAAAEFFHRLGSGENMGKGNPILSLRNRLIGPYGSTRRTTTEDQINLTVRAWNAWIRGRTLDNVLVSTQWDKPGKLIEILGPEKAWKAPAADVADALEKEANSTTSVDEWLEENGEPDALGKLVAETVRPLAPICTCPNFPKTVDFECPVHSNELLG